MATRDLEFLLVFDTSLTSGCAVGETTVAELYRFAIDTVTSFSATATATHAGTYTLNEESLTSPATIKALNIVAKGSPLVRDSIEIRSESSGQKKGRGLFTARSFRLGETVYAEGVFRGGFSLTGCLLR